MTSTADAECHLDDGGDSDLTARAVAAVRRTAVALIGADPGTDLSEVAQRIHALADDLETRVPSARDRIESMDREGRGSRYSPVVGAHNAVAPRVDLGVTADGAEGTVSFSTAYERAPGVVHEGAVALVLDVALANANALAGVAGMTAQLNIRFHHPVPPDRELTIRSRHERVDGRKAYSSAEVWLGDKLCVSADGLFIASRKRVPHAG